MLKTQFRRVESELTGARSMAVERVTDDRDPQTKRMRCMNAQLVGSPRDGYEMDTSHVRLDAQFFPFRDSDLSVDRVVNLVWPIIDVDAKGEFDRAALCREDPVEQGDIAFTRLASLELHR